MNKQITTILMLSITLIVVLYIVRLTSRSIDSYETTDTNVPTVTKVPTDTKVPTNTKVPTDVRLLPMCDFSGTFWKSTFNTDEGEEAQHMYYKIVKGTPAGKEWKMPTSLDLTLPGRDTIKDQADWNKLVTKVISPIDTQDAINAKNEYCNYRANDKYKTANPKAKAIIISKALKLNRGQEANTLINENVYVKDDNIADWVGSMYPADDNAIVPSRKWTCVTSTIDPADLKADENVIITTGTTTPTDAAKEAWYNKVTGTKHKYCKAAHGSVISNMIPPGAQYAESGSLVLTKDDVSPDSSNLKGCDFEYVTYNPSVPDERSGTVTAAKYAEQNSICNTNMTDVTDSNFPDLKCCTAPIHMNGSTKEERKTARDNLCSFYFANDWRPEVESVSTDVKPAPLGALIPVNANNVKTGKNLPTFGCSYGKLDLDKACLNAFNTLTYYKEDGTTATKQVFNEKTKPHFGLGGPVSQPLPIDSRPYAGKKGHHCVIDIDINRKMGGLDDAFMSTQLCDKKDGFPDLNNMCYWYKKQPKSGKIKPNIALETSDFVDRLAGRTSEIRRKTTLDPNTSLRKLFEDNKWWLGLSKSGDYYPLGGKCYSRYSSSPCPTKST